MSQRDGRANGPSHDHATPAEAAFGSLIKTLGLLKRVMEPHFVQFGLSSSQWAVLHALHRCDAATAPDSANGADAGNCAGNAATPSLRLTDLGDRLIVRPASITGVVDRLVRLGLVARTASVRDHRAKNVTLTQAGRDLVGRVLEHHPAQMHRVMAGLTAAQQTEFGQLLERRSSHLELLSR